MENDLKDLLIKELSARLPYGVKIEHTSGFIGALNNLTTYQLYDGDNIKDIYCAIDFFGDDDYISVEYFRPYLFPLSSMTEEQKEEYCQLQQKIIYNSKGVVNEDITEYINWCYKKHLDINDLISKGLAIDATNLNIY